jgi:G:T/U-mismatch repair DNA glycosylase
MHNVILYASAHLEFENFTLGGATDQKCNFRFGGHKSVLTENWSPKFRQSIERKEYYRFDVISGLQEA